MKRSMRLLVLALVVSLTMASWSAIGFAQTPAGEPVVEPSISETSITWNTPQGGAGFVLVVSGPNGYRFEQTFPGGAQPVFQAADAAGAPLADGLYKYELRPIRPDLAKAPTQGEEGREAGETRDLAQSQVAPNVDSAASSAAFTIQGGRILVRAEGEESTGPTAGAAAQTAGPSEVNAPDVVLTNGDGVVRNSLCVGFDCPDAPVFSDSTILLMENNTRIKFGDTSTSPFPSNDWEIEANSSSSGGANYLGFNDCGTADNDGGCATDLVFAVEAGARQSALYVESDGDVGLGTSNPVLDLHIVTGNTPSIRLDQDGSSGFTAQVWDVAGNEANFFIRDVTNGSRLPFRIRPGAPTSAIDIAADGDVGVGTASPSATLHVRRTDGTAKVLVEEVRGTAARRDLLTLANNGNASILFRRVDSGIDWRLTAGGNLNFSEESNNETEFRLSNNGNLTIAGTLTTGGPTCAGGCRQQRDAFVQNTDLLAKLSNVPIMRWTDTASDANDPDGSEIAVTHVIPELQSFYEAYGYGLNGESVAPLDVATVALASAQALQATVDAQNAIIEAQNAQIAALEARLTQVEAMTHSHTYLPSVQQ